MTDIGGNTAATIQVSTITKNAIGEHVETWKDAQTLTGWLDLISGDSSNEKYLAKIKESTDVFVSDYIELDSRIDEENARMVIDGQIYDLKLIDDPMKMHLHLEFYLKYTGGQ